MDNDGARFDEENCTTSRICYLSEGVAVNVHNLCLQYKGAGPFKKKTSTWKVHNPGDHYNYLCIKSTRCWFVERWFQYCVRYE